MGEQRVRFTSKVLTSNRKAGGLLKTWTKVNNGAYKNTATDCRVSNWKTPNANNAKGGLWDVHWDKVNKRIMVQYGHAFGNEWFSQCNDAECDDGPKFVPSKPFFPNR